MEDIVKRIYLAGPIAGLSNDYVQSRNNFWTERLSRKAGLYIPHPTQERVGPSNSGRSIYSRDIWAIRNCDIVLADMRSCVKSLGTVAELTAAHLLGKLVIVVGGGDLIDHPFVCGPADTVFAEADEAVEYLNRILTEFMFR